MKPFKNRIYKSGTGIQWCFWRWSDAQEPYLTRLFVFKTPWFALCVNKIKQADVGDPHDHTSAFLSVMLRGWYTERRIRTRNERGVTVTREQIRERRHLNYVRASDTDAHRILDVALGGCYTLCMMGPKVREWFYHTPEGLIHWSKYKEQGR